MYKLQIKMFSGRVTEKTDVILDAFCVWDLFLNKNMGFK